MLLNLQRALLSLIEIIRTWYSCCFLSSCLAELQYCCVLFLLILHVNGDWYSIRINIRCLDCKVSVLADC
jgi:hypothetical protein